MLVELVLAGALTGALTGAQDGASAGTAVPPSRAEMCLARVEDLIIEAGRETGRVAGPSWFIRDWWMAKAEEAGKPLTREARAVLVRQVASERAAAPEAAASARRDCIQEAIDAGAVPGL